MKKNPRIAQAEKILIDNGIEADEAETVLQAVGYALLDIELYDNQHGGSIIEKLKDQYDLCKVPSKGKQLMTRYGIKWS